MPQPIPPVQKLSPEFKRRQQVLERQYATLDQAQQMLFGQKRPDTVFNMADTLSPGTQVPMLPYS